MVIMSGYSEVAGKQKQSENRPRGKIMGTNIYGIKRNGFSLTELMITLAITGILAAVAYPVYTGFMSTGARAAGQADLMALAAAMERHRAANFTYAGAASGGGNTGSPAIFATHSPSSEPESKKRYNLAIDSVATNGISYVISATPVSGTIQEGDGKLFYYSDGRKAWDKNNNGSIASTEFCWQC